MRPQRAQQIDALIKYKHINIIMDVLAQCVAIVTRDAEATRANGANECERWMMHRMNIAQPKW